MTLKSSQLSTEKNTIDEVLTYAHEVTERAVHKFLGDILTTVIPVGI